MNKNNCVLKQGDCLELLKEIENDSVDLILCDPPYGTIKGAGKQWTITRSEWDVKLDMKALFEEYGRILRENGRVILFSQEPFTREIRSLKDSIVKFKYSLVWFKNNAGNPLSANKKPLNYHEDISVFQKVKDSNFSHPLREYAKEVIETVADGNKRAFLSKIGKKNDNFFTAYDRLQFSLCSKEYYDNVVEIYSLNKYPFYLTYEELKEINDTVKPFVFNRLTDKAEKSVLKYAKDPKPVHSTQKPVKLLEHIIKMYTNEGALVIDHCMGSGSTGIACANTGRKFIGFELDEKYFNIAKERVEKAYEQEQSTILGR